MILETIVLWTGFIVLMGIFMLILWICLDRILAKFRISWRVLAFVSKHREEWNEFNNKKGYLDEMPKTFERRFGESR